MAGPEPRQRCGISLAATEVVIGGVRVHYLVGGAQGGRPLVFLHGIGGGSGDWSESLAYFIEHGTRVYAPDLPGHGGSDPPPRDWDPHEGGRMVLDLLDAWEIEKATVVGHSAGGLLGLQVALEDPQRVEALVLAAPAGLEQRLGWLLRLLAVPLLGELLWRPWRLEARLAMNATFADRSRITEEMLNTWLERRRDPQQRAAFLRLLRHGVGPLGLREDLLIRDYVGNVRCPVLVVWGQEDGVIPLPSNPHNVISRFWLARLAVLSPCGHWPQVEQAEAFNGEVGRFLGLRT